VAPLYRSLSEAPLTVLAAARFASLVFHLRNFRKGCAIAWKSCFVAFLGHSIGGDRKRFLPSVEMTGRRVCAKEPNTFGILASGKSASNFRLMWQDMTNRMTATPRIQGGSLCQRNTTSRIRISKRATTVAVKGLCIAVFAAGRDTARSDVPGTISRPVTTPKPNGKIACSVAARESQCMYCGGTGNQLSYDAGGGGRSG
jgi:hypothetical protein